LRIEITSALRLSAAYRLDRRSTTDGAGTLASDVVAEPGDGRSELPASALLAVGLASSYLRMNSTGAGVFSMLPGRPDAEIQWGRLEARLALWGGHLDDAGLACMIPRPEPRRGCWRGSRATWTGLPVSIGRASVTSAGLATDRYARHVFLAGWSATSTGSSPRFSRRRTTYSPCFSRAGATAGARRQAGDVRAIGSVGCLGRSTPLRATRAAWLVGGLADLPRGLIATVSWRMAGGRAARRRTHPRRRLRGRMPWST